MARIICVAAAPRSALMLIPALSIPSHFGTSATCISLRELYSPSFDGSLWGRHNQHSGVRAKMDTQKRCAECDEIATEMRAAFIRLLTKHVTAADLPTQEELVQFLASLFAYEQNLARLSELWGHSEFSAARARWLEHRKTTGHTGFFQYLAFECASE